MKRSDRLVAMTNYLIEHPMELISLPFFFGYVWCR